MSITHSITRIVDIVDIMYKAMYFCAHTSYCKPNDEMIIQKWVHKYSPSRS